MEVGSGVEVDVSVGGTPVCEGSVVSVPVGLLEAVGGIELVELEAAVSEGRPVSLPGAQPARAAAAAAAVSFKNIRRERGGWRGIIDSRNIPIRFVR